MAATHTLFSLFWKKRMTDGWLLASDLLALGVGWQFCPPSASSPLARAL